MQKEVIMNIAQELINRERNNGLSQEDLQQFIYEFLVEKNDLDLLSKPFFFRFLVSEIDYELNK